MTYCFVNDLYDIAFQCYFQLFTWRNERSPGILSYKNVGSLGKVNGLNVDDLLEHVGDLGVAEKDLFRY